jgi:hypothetical protein
MEGGQDLYDAASLSEFLARGKRWEWKNPVTNIKIKRIDYFRAQEIKTDFLKFYPYKLG